MQITAIIVDDEAPGRAHLTKLLALVSPEVKVVSTADSVASGRQAIKTYHPDIVFLDIRMPGESGFDLVNSQRERDFALIFVTAHQDFALDAIKARTVDFLLKPLDMEELKVSVDRAKEFLIGKRRNEATFFANPMEATIPVPTNAGTRLVALQDIVYLTACDNYTYVHLSINRERYLISKNLGQLEEELPAAHFFRTHKSFLVNIHHLKEYLRHPQSRIIMSNGDQVTLARRKRTDFLARIKDLGNPDL
ncbi:MAG: LytTR family DNA-binding domain-containing protein [Bacteroidia bacterium]|nr:LytTR family DNA-binding domain-containing protein [Bacteroidia bacterium]